jgi:hypothetical protein
MRRILLIVTLIISYSCFSQRGVLRLCAGSALGENAGKNSGIYLLSVGPLLGKHISINPSVGYIKFSEDAKGFVPVGGDVTIHSFHSRKKVVPLFIFGAYFPLSAGKDPNGTHGEFMGRLGIGGMAPVSKNIKLGLSANYMPFFTTKEEWYWTSTRLRNLFSMSVEVMFTKLK